MTKLLLALTMIISLTYNIVDVNASAVTDVATKASSTLIHTR